MNLSTRKITTIYLVMFALIFNAVTSSVAYGMKQDSVLFCTSQGYKWLKVESETSKSERAQQHCELCLFPPSNDHSDDFIVNAGSVSLPVAERAPNSNPDYQLANARFTYLVAQGRAPPINTSSI